MDSSLELKQRRHLDVAQLLFSNSYAGIAVSFVASYALVYAFYDQSIPMFKFWWLILMTAVLSVRFIDTCIWHKTSPSSLSKAKSSIYRYITGTYITAFLWSAYALTILSHADTIELTSTLITISALAGGAATVLSAHKTTSIMYTIILLIPASTVLLSHSEEHHHMLGVLGIAFSCAMAVTANKAANFTSQAIQLKNQNLSLLNTMEEKVDIRTRKIYELSHLDPLTNLFNRSAFLKSLNPLLSNVSSKESSLAVLFIDLDNFKHVNDSMGHEVGDILLKKIANRLKDFCADDQLLCRWGGDEFLVVLPDTQKELAIDTANHLIDRISSLYTIKNNNFSIGATIGIAMYPEHATTANSLIQLADSAMYDQKSILPCCVEIFSTGLQNKLERENKLKDGLTNAIANKELHLNYQPIISAKTQHVYSCEALVRWTLNGEVISPVEFIPLAEQYGHIIEIGTWVLEQACLQASKWPTINAIAVNVSVIQLEDQQFINIVENALSKSNLPPEKLHIEITESVFSDNTAVILQQIKALQNKGIKVSIDDFGTGYSSLSVIQDLNVNIIKIDRSFVTQLNANGFSIISAVLQIASSLGYKVVAEGIEELYQADKLAEMGVDYLQGFLYSKPMDAQAFEKYIETR